jgi:hypothetical protein
MDRMEPLTVNLPGCKTGIIIILTLLFVQPHLIVLNMSSFCHPCSQITDQYTCDILLGDVIRWYCGEPAISLHSHTVPLVQVTTCLLPVMRDPGSIPRGVLMWNWDSPVSDVSLHWWPQRDLSLWSRLRQASSRTVTRPLCWQCDNPTWSHTAILT